MTDAPERMWVFPKKDWFCAGASSHKIVAAGANDVEYIRADLHQQALTPSAPAPAPMTGLEIARALSELSKKAGPYRNTGFALIDAFLRHLAEQEEG